MSPSRRAGALLDWGHHEYRWSPVAVWFGLRYFAPKQPATRWLRGLKSPNRAGTIARLRNVAWDLTVVSTWLARKAEQRSKNVLWILCSLDRAVLEIAEGVFIPDLAPGATTGHPGDTTPPDMTPTAAGLTPGEWDDPAPAMLQMLYGPRDGARLHTQYVEWLAKRRNPERAYHGLRGQFPADFIESLEREVTRGAPGAASSDAEW